MLVQWVQQILLKLDFNNFQSYMDKLLESRRQKEHAQKVEGLSPEKYGKGAYCDLTYTPSKLADNVLFREVSSLKRVEQQSSRSRELEAQNQMLTEQVTYLKKERDGISASLNDIIDMYKGIIAQMEAKNDQLLKQSQRKTNSQIQRYIKDKQEEARYFQSERELLEERIEALEIQVQSLRNELADTLNNKSDAERNLEMMVAENKHLQQKQLQQEEQAKKQLEQSKAETESLKKEYMLAEVQWRNQLNQSIHKKEKEMEALERSHRAQLDKLEVTRKNEALLKNQEINEITKAFEKESDRLKDILSVKDRMIENLTVENNKEKNRILKMTQDYETEISHLTHEKNRLIDELEYLGKDNEILAKDKVLLAGDLQKQNANLRELLLESSRELERCKKEFLGLGRENGLLLEKLKDVQGEARTWRDSYYLNKARHY